MNATSDNVLHVKKYPNRRYYDSTRGEHVSLAGLHDLVCAGHEIQVTDSQTGEDITHVVLTQIILDHHAPKLAIFPAAILHQIIRTQQAFLGGVIEQFVRQSLAVQQQTQEQWARMWQSALSVASAPPTATAPPPPHPAGPAPSAPPSRPGASPFDWSRSWIDALTAATRPPALPGSDPAHPPPDTSAATPAPGERDELRELREQIAALTRRLEALDAREAQANRAGEGASRQAG